MRKIFLLFLLFAGFFAAANPFSDEYDRLCADLREYNTIGYKAGFEGATPRLFEQGALFTGFSPLDFAVIGQGFVRVYDGEGNIFYTRACSFKIDKDGYLKTAGGLIFLPEVRVENPAEEVIAAVDRDNTLVLTNSGKTQSASMDLFMPDSESTVEYKNGCYVFSQAVPVSGGVIRQSILESSTVNAVETILRMQYLLLRQHENDNGVSALFSYKLGLLQQLFTIFSLEPLLSSRQTALLDFEKRKIVFHGSSIDQLIEYLW